MRADHRPPPAKALALALAFATGMAAAPHPVAADTPEAPAPSSLAAEIAQIETLLERIDGMIRDQDRRLDEMGERLDATPDPEQRRQLEAVAMDWTEALDRMEAQRDTLARLLSELRDTARAEAP